MGKLIDQLQRLLHLRRRQQATEVAPAEIIPASPVPVLRGRQPPKSEVDDSISAEAELEPVLTMRIYRAATQEWTEA